MYSIDVRLQQSPTVARKRVVARCEKSSQNLRCLKKHLLHTLDKLKENFVDNYIMNVTIEENIQIISNKYSNDVRLEQRFGYARIPQDNRCEN